MHDEACAVDIGQWLFFLQTLNGVQTFSGAGRDLAFGEGKDVGHTHCGLWGDALACGLPSAADSISQLQTQKL